MGVALILRWFLIPALVVTIGVTLVGIIAVVTTREMTPAELLYEMRPGNSETRRWQAAFGLSTAVTAKRDELPEGFTQQVIRYLDDAIDDRRGDPRFRQFLAVVLLNLGDREAIPVLEKALGVEEDVQMRISAMRALSEIATEEDGLSSPIIRMMGDSDAGARKVAAYAAGKIGGPVTIRPLSIALEDPVVDVRWNAALSLARLGDDSGHDQLASMLDREYVREVSNLDWEGESAVVRNAVLGLARLDGGRYSSLLSRVAEEDEDPEVRQLAGDALRVSASQ
jgi:HEAT repeat protein